MGGLRELMEQIAQGDLTVDEGLRGMAERLRPDPSGAVPDDPGPEVERTTVAGT